MLSWKKDGSEQESGAELQAKGGSLLPLLLICMRHARLVLKWRNDKLGANTT
jgi:hypothetical protein